MPTPLETVPEDRDLAEQMPRWEASISTKGISQTRSRRQPDGRFRLPVDEVFGIDFWHAVEFSRNGRTPIARLLGSFSGQPYYFSPFVPPGQIQWTGSDRACRGALPARTHTLASQPTAASSRGAALRTGHLAVSGAPCRGGTENSMQPGYRSQIEQGMRVDLG